MDAGLKRKLEELGLARVSDQLLSLSRTSVRFVTAKSDDANIPIGTSKVGGRPDLPPHATHPEWNGEPLSFLAQINLAALGDFGTSSELPTSGILSFFYHLSQPWGYDPKHFGGWRVLYIADLKNLERSAPPGSLPKDGRYPACTLSFYEQLTFPPYESRMVEDLALTEEETHRYFDLLDEATDKAPTNRISGYPDPLQGNMQLECQMVSNGIYYGDAKAHLHPRYQELKPGAVDWKLLLQLDSEEKNARMIWGDYGRLYYWIHQSALKNREFQKTWLTLQCT